MAQTRIKSWHTSFGIGWLMSVLVLLSNFSCSNEDNANAAEINHKVQELISQMTLDEKIGQIAQVDRQFLADINDIKEYYLGSLLSGGGSTPEVNAPEAWADMYDQYQSIALQTRLKIPLIYGIDAVHGHNNVVGAVIFPHNIGLGCTNNPESVRKAAEVTAKEVYATGINWTFSPCIAVPRDERWGRTYEGFSESPDIVVSLGEAAVQGYQGENLGAANTILASAKHFVGDGGTTWGTGMGGQIDRGDVAISEEQLREIHLAGYIAAIEAGVKSVMISFSSVNGEKMHGNRNLITDLLKEELGFDGMVVSDWAGINELPGDFKSDIEQSINAGIDVVMIPDRYQEFLSLLKELVNEDRISVDRIDDAVGRILRVKYELGLFENPYADRSEAANIGSEEHRSAARECVRQSVVLLKNESILPLSKAPDRIHVSGRFADDIGAQCGGWTISWQGGLGDITPGTSILDAITATVGPGTQVTSSADGTGADGANVAVIVIGEAPYAEMQGDRSDLSLAPEDLAVISNLKETGIPVVAILLSGRPLIIEDQLPHLDALLAAWLPGTECQGVADVLFGDYSPTGKLSFTWPRSMAQLPINVGDTDYDPLFKYGFGLSY